MISSHRVLRMIFLVLFSKHGIFLVPFSSYIHDFWWAYCIRERKKEHVCRWCLLNIMAQSHEQTRDLAKKIKSSFHNTSDSRSTLPPIIMVQWKMALLETKVIFQAPIFHWTMIMGERVSTVHKSRKGWTQIVRQKFGIALKALWGEWHLQRWGDAVWKSNYERLWRIRIQYGWHLIVW